MISSDILLYSQINNFLCHCQRGFYLQQIREPQPEIIQMVRALIETSPSDASHLSAQGTH